MRHRPRNRRSRPRSHTRPRRQPPGSNPHRHARRPRLHLPSRHQRPPQPLPRSRRLSRQSTRSLISRQLPLRALGHKTRPQAQALLHHPTLLLRRDIAVDSSSPPRHNLSGARQQRHQSIQNRRLLLLLQATQSPFLGPASRLRPRPTANTNWPRRPRPLEHYRQTNSRRQRRPQASPTSARPKSSASPKMASPPYAPWPNQRQPTCPR